VIFTGHPFSVYTVPEMTLIEGQIYFDRQLDMQQREARKREKAELIKREQSERRPSAGRTEKKDEPEPMPNEPRIDQ